MEVAMIDSTTGSGGVSANIFQTSPANDANAQKKSETIREDVKGEKSASNEMMKEIAESVQEQINLMNSSLSFQVYGKDNDKIAIVVSDKATGKVIREVPAKEVQKMQVKLDELIGLIFNGLA